MTHAAGGVVHFPVTNDPPRKPGVRSPLCSEGDDSIPYGKGDRLAFAGVPDTITCPTCLNIMSKRNIQSIYLTPTHE
jgi:hypothetical protein